MWLLEKISFSVHIIVAAAKLKGHIILCISQNNLKEYLRESG